MKTESRLLLLVFGCPVRLQSIRRCHVHGSFRLLHGIFPKQKESKKESFGDARLLLWIVIYVNQTLTVTSHDQAVLRCVTWNTDGGRLMVEGLNGHVQGRPCAANWAGQVPEVSKADKNSQGLSQLLQFKILENFGKQRQFLKYILYITLLSP